MLIESTGTYRYAYAVDANTVRDELAKRGIYPFQWTRYFKAFGEIVRREYCKIDKLNEIPVRKGCECFEGIIT